MAFPQHYKFDIWRMSCLVWTTLFDTCRLEDEQMFNAYPRGNLMLESARSIGSSDSDNGALHMKAAASAGHIVSRVLHVGVALSLGVVASACFARGDVDAVHANGSAQSPSTATCVACHGAQGAGSETGARWLAGKNADYLAHALSMFKAGTRASATMQAVALGLSDSDIRALAVFFANQHPPIVKASTPPSSALVTAGQQLAEKGAGDNVPACFSCHAAGGKGNGARIPAIAGEPAAFTIARLHEFQMRAEAGQGKPGTMTAVAASLNEMQIEQAAAYLSVTGPWRLKAMQIGARTMHVLV
jgi:cytochrome c553